MEKDKLYAYLAGFLDADGSIRIIHVKGGPTWGEQFVPKVGVTNTCKEVLELFKKEFGGNLREIKQGKARNNQNISNWKVTYEWSVSSKACCAALTKLCPDLRIKFHQARLAIRLSKLKVKFSHRWFSDDFKQKKRNTYFKLWKRCCDFNARGSDKNKREYKNIIKPSGDLLIWMAGFIDADGTISISTDSKDRPFIPKLFVYNTSFVPICIFTNMFGGKYRERVYSKTGYKKNWNSIFEWSIVKKKASGVISDIYPFLVVKKKQANLVIRLQNIRNKYGSSHRRWSPGDRGRCNMIYERLKTKCKTLNKRGLNNAY